MSGMTEFDINTLQLSSSQHLFKGKLAVDRAETHDIVHWILSTIPAREDHKICLLTGTAGQGKTVVLQNLLKEMERHEKFPVFALKADLVDFDNIDANDFIARYEQEFQSLSGCGLWPVLVIDQIDALSKTLSADRKPINLLDKLINAVCQAKNACVIVSCRPYDLDFDPVLSKYKYKKKISLGNLKAEEVNRILREFGMREYTEGSKMLAFLSVPINLELFLEYGREDDQITTLQSLLDTLWRKKISEVADKKANITTTSLIECLNEITTSLNKSSSLACSRKALEDRFTKELSYLISENILTDTARIGYVSFVHQSLADYISARLLVTSGQTMAELLESEHQGLYVRNRVKQYFTYIREADENLYLQEVKRILVDEASKYRVHIKMLILTTMAGFEQPTEEEKHFVGQYVLTDDIYSSMFMESVYRKGWFEYVSEHSFLRNKLQAGHASTVQMVKDMCENVMIFDGHSMASFLLSQIREGDTAWNRNWMDVAERFSDTNRLTSLIPLYENAKGDEPLKYNEYLERLASVDYGYVEKVLLKHIGKELEKQMAEKDTEGFVFRVVYLDSQAFSILENLFESDKDRTSTTYLKVIRLIDDVSKYGKDDVFLHQESHAYFTYNDSSYYNNHEKLVIDYLEYASKAIEENPDGFKAIVNECLHDERCIVYYMGLRMCRMNLVAFKTESLSILTNKKFLEELDSKLSYQIVRMLEDTFPLMTEEEKKKVLDICSTIAPKWEKTPLPILREHQELPLYHIGRRKQEYLTVIPPDYLKKERNEDWLFLQRMERELDKADVHEPYKIYTKSGWGSHRQETMKLMKKKDMLKAFKKYESNSPGFDERPTRQGECMNFQSVVTQNPSQYIDVIEAILEDRGINREYAAYGIIGLMKADYSMDTIQAMTDRLIAELMEDLSSVENYYPMMDILREMDYFIKRNAISETMMEYMCRIVKEYPEEHYKDENLELRQDVFNTGINRARGNAAFHLVMCYKMTEYGQQIFDALESCVDGSPATKGAIVLQQALLNHLDLDRNFKLYMDLVKERTPSLVSIPLGQLHPLVYFINVRFEELKSFFISLYDVPESHDMLSQLLWIAWVRGKADAKELLHDLLIRSDKAKGNIIRYFDKETVTKFFKYVKPVAEWCADSDDEEVGKVYDYFVNDMEDLNWEDARWFVNTYARGKVFAYAGNQFLEFMKDSAAEHPEDVLKWMCYFAKAEHKGESRMFLASRTLSNLVAAYNAIRKYDKNNELLEKALDTMDDLMAQQQVRRGMLHFLYELDNN